MSEQLTALDATFLELEQADESAHMHIGAIMLFDPKPDGGSSWMPSAPRSSSCSLLRAASGPVRRAPPRGAISRRTPTSATRRTLA
jgi:hypothetical protein